MVQDQRHLSGCSVECEWRYAAFDRAEGAIVVLEGYREREREREREIERRLYYKDGR